ncbi:MAG TPA: aminotransferase class V-fold PLP-dependent enzyme [Acidimicrobiales bacterium]|nr:aminotransferase class V-fold PLP-dependent enzyme [Acidimicrobiales bacterium]
MTRLPIRLVGDGVAVPCVDGQERPYISLDGAASTGAMPAVAERVAEFLPWYASIHRASGYKSRLATTAYEDARADALAFAGKADTSDLAIICRNTTDAINHLAYRLRLLRDDVVVTTVIEHHANLLPWSRVARRRFVECGSDGTFSVDDVSAALDDEPKPRLLAITGASNVTGWLPPLDLILDAAHERGVPVLVDAAQLAPHVPLPSNADFLAWSGHKMYAPFGAGVLTGPREVFSQGEPFLFGGGAVDLVDLEEVEWTDPPEREEAGSPNVVGAVAMATAMRELTDIGWPAIREHEEALAQQLRTGLAAIPGVKLLGPALPTPTLAVATFVVEEVPHALVAARLAAEYGIGVRHGCFCAHPYLIRLLRLSRDEQARYRQQVRAGDRSVIPGAVRASATIATTTEEVRVFLAAVADIASGKPPPVAFEQDEHTGDFWPELDVPGWSAADRILGASCGRG